MFGFLRFRAYAMASIATYVNICHEHLETKVVPGNASKCLCSVRIYFTSNNKETVA